MQTVKSIDVLIAKIIEKKRRANATLLAPMQLPMIPLVASYNPRGTMSIAVWIEEIMVIAAC